MAEGGLLGRVLQEVEDRTGRTLVNQDYVEHLEEAAREGRALAKDLDLLGWTVLDYVSGNPHELNAKSRRKWAQESRNIWLQDPQAGAAVDLMNDFTFGRGVPKPKARDEEVQKVIDEAWDDPDNQLVLTSYAAQVALGTDLSLQANVFLLVFEGDDGKVKLALLNHDEVENVVRDPNNRQRPLYYLAIHKRQEWDYEQDQPKIDVTGQFKPKKVYYEHWRNVTDVEEAGGQVSKPPKGKVGEGRVYHISINRTSEQVFGVPPMRRLVRWFSAYNDFMSARVDMAQAAAAFIMRRKIKGTPNQVAKMAAKAISRRSELSGATGTGDTGPQSAPRGGSILTENENVTHENMKLDTGSGGASQDAQMIRANISAGIRFPQSYLGDPSNSNLATATSLELPVLKAVESRQEVFEQVFRWVLDRVIERAVDAGILDKYADEEEPPPAAPVPPGAESPFEGDTGEFGPTALTQGYEDQGEDEDRTERDLGYEFSMPNPLRRMMTDLANVLSNIAKTFDPNGTNVELSRILLNIALGEALEVQDPGDAVERIFPEGYQDPAIQAAMAQQGGVGGTGQFGPPGAPGADGQQHTEGNPYGAPMQASPPEQMQQGAVTRGRDGEPVFWPDQLRLEERRYAELPETAQVRTRADKTTVERLWDDDVETIVTAELGRLMAQPHNNNGGNHD